MQSPDALRFLAINSHSALCSLGASSTRRRVIVTDGRLISTQAVLPAKLKPRVAFVRSPSNAPRDAISRPLNYSNDHRVLHAGRRMTMTAGCQPPRIPDRPIQRRRNQVMKFSGRKKKKYIPTSHRDTFSPKEYSSRVRAECVAESAEVESVIRL